MSLKTGAVHTKGVHVCTPVAGGEPVIVDLAEFVSNITIFEDISKPFLTGRMTIIDGIDVIKGNALVGQETVTINLDLPNEEAQFDAEDEDKRPRVSQCFRIYSITDYKRLADGMASYVLHFVDPMAYTCHQTKVNRVLRGAYSDMLATVLMEDAGLEFLKTGDSGIEKSSPGNMQLVVPSWNINRLIKFFCENADVDGNKTWKNSMFFYQIFSKVSEKDNQFRFQSFQTMTSKEQESEKTFLNINFEHMDPTDPKDEADNFMLRQMQILQYDRPQKANTLNGVKSGAYASKMITYDPVRKIHEEIVYNMQEVFNRGGNHVGEVPMIRTKEDGLSVYSVDEIEDFTEIFVEQKSEESYSDFTHYRVNMTNAYSDEEKLVDASDDKVVMQQRGMEYRDSADLERYALKSLMSQNVTKVTIPFQSGLNVGQTVTLGITTPDAKRDAPEFDKLEGSRYLIGKMTYQIMPQEGMGRIQITTIKESYDKEIGQVLQEGYPEDDASSYSDEKVGEG